MGTAGSQAHEQETTYIYLVSEPHMRINLSCYNVLQALSGSHNARAVLWWLPGRPCIARRNKLSGGDLFIPVKFALLLIDLPELHRAAMMGTFKHAVKVGHIIKPG